MIVNSVTQYIEENIEIKHIDIEGLVSYSGYSRRYLQKIFKNKIGFSIGKYIQLRRISRAAVLLRLTSLSLSSISTRLCYDSQQTFTREFKKNTGYTPLQYRNNKLLTFQGMIGHRDTNDLFPYPKLYHIDKKTIDGFLFKHKEKLPYTGEQSKVRLREINKRLISAKTVYLSNKISLGKDFNNGVLITTIIWTNSEQVNTQFEINSGLYAGFLFTGSHKSYSHFIYHIYMNLLPFYNLTKRDEFDIEIISKEDNTCTSFSFQCYIPVLENDQLDLPCDVSSLPAIPGC
ncbi:helix-turn-helix domain-containing protein [Providencia rustigianii]|uniref:helix-turn-helix domain-containing protein n=1 Tax=Providencia rustigianii TaxID=158850 RepID=UPI0035EF2151